MKYLFNGVVAVAGCVWLAGVSVADSTDDPPDGKSDSTPASQEGKASSSLPKPNRWSMKGHSDAHVGIKETEDSMRGRRPK